jgi:hypothetical protein
MKPEYRLIAETEASEAGTELRDTRSLFACLMGIPGLRVSMTRLELGPTELLAKSRGSLQDITSQVVRGLHTVAVHTMETERAA